MKEVHKLNFDEILQLRIEIANIFFSCELMNF